jgi:hypothetical protein
MCNHMGRKTHNAKDHMHLATCSISFTLGTITLVLILDKAFNGRSVMPSLIR